MSTQTTNLNLTQPQLSDQISQSIPAMATNFGTIDSEFGLGGTTANRPTTGLYVGRKYFDTSIGIEIFWNGTRWVDGNGRTPATPMSSAPTTGTWNIGDIVWNSAPVAGGNVGWICISAGTPGVWKPFGLISTV